MPMMGYESECPRCGVLLEACRKPDPQDETGLPVGGTAVNCREFGGELRWLCLPCVAAVDAEVEQGVS